MLTNTREFSREAQHFDRYGFYTSAPKGTLAYKDYWDEQIRRCKEGYSVAGTKISGYHYWYLNFCKIVLVREEDALATSGERVKGERMEAFPSFWDIDYKYFNAVEKAEQEGKHLIVLKARGKGFSFKNGAMLSRNYFLYPKALQFLLGF